MLNGLPATGTWTVTRHPDEVATPGEGTTTTESGIPAGTFTFSVTSEEGCTSAVSANVVINPQPGSPTAPVVGQITQPTCSGFDRKCCPERFTCNGYIYLNTAAQRSNPYR